MYGNLALLDDSGTFESGERVYLTELKGKDEAWLRDTLFDHPEIIPITEIDPSFGPLVPLCKELRTDVGSIDAVFINERGRLTIVECKLWKNPEARRQVVAQTLDYVSAQLCCASVRAGSKGAQMPNGHVHSADGAARGLGADADRRCA